MACKPRGKRGSRPLPQHRQSTGTMYISTAANIANIVGNCIGVFALDLGAAGVAYPSLLCRLIPAAAVTLYCFREKNEIRYHIGDIFCWDGKLLGKIMHIALPNGVESGIHHLVKVALSSMVALFGTYQIAANGLAQSIWSLASIMGLAMAPAYTTVIGQCMGAQDIESANFYFRKLNRHFRGSKIAGGLAGADKQYLQRAGISVCRSAGKRPAGSRGRKIHDAGFNLSDDRRPQPLAYADQGNRCAD